MQQWLKEGMGESDLTEGISSDWVILFSGMSVQKHVSTWG